TEGTKYLATIYRDASDAHWQNNPEAYAIDKMIVDSKSGMWVKLAAGGGAAISLAPATTEQIKEFGTKKKKKK
ncbi:MAG: glycoside hydrolase family 97 C-terminal domain-containing protein, partial [Chitinophagaceae bacterium]|nr:glycoside hydrolase family 97 C-terminal domain-containing protein [Chitinophagaceae bacterium]